MLLSLMCQSITYHEKSFITKLSKTENAERLHRVTPLAKQVILKNKNAPITNVLKNFLS
jgi:hypothetical protein